MCRSISVDPDNVLYLAAVLLLLSGSPLDTVEQGDNSAVSVADVTAGEIATSDGYEDLEALANDGVAVTVLGDGVVDSENRRFLPLE